jgi:hypothetical protein
MKVIVYIRPRSLKIQTSLTLTFFHDSVLKLALRFSLLHLTHLNLILILISKMNRIAINLS